MMFPGFTNPATNSTILRRAVPFHDDMDMLLGEWSASGEAVLWFGSVLSGLVFCKLVRFSPYLVCSSFIIISTFSSILFKAEELSFCRDHSYVFLGPKCAVVTLGTFVRFRGSMISKEISKLCNLSGFV